MDSFYNESVAAEILSQNLLNFLNQFLSEE
jgi:hypothetical protein